MQIHFFKICTGQEKVVPLQAEMATESLTETISMDSHHAFGIVITN